MDARKDKTTTATSECRQALVMRATNATEATHSITHVPAGTRLVVSDAINNTTYHRMRTHELDNKNAHHKHTSCCANELEHAHTNTGLHANCAHATNACLPSYTHICTITYLHVQCSPCTYAYREHRYAWHIHNTYTFANTRTHGDPARTHIQNRY